MTTLQDIKKAAGLTNAAVGRALGCSPAKAGLILHGAHISVFTDEEIARLADVLGITFERCWLAMRESCNELAGTPGRAHQRSAERLAEVQVEMKERLPEIAHKIEVEQPRPWTEVDGTIVTPEDKFPLLRAYMEKYPPWPTVIDGDIAPVISDEAHLIGQPESE